MKNLSNYLNKSLVLVAITLDLTACVVEPTPVAPGPPVNPALYYGCCYAYPEYPPYYGYSYYGPSVAFGYYGGGGWHGGGWHH